MGRIGEEIPALAQRFVDEKEIAAAKIAHAAVHEFGAAAGCAGAKIAALEKGRTITSCGRVNGTPQAGRPATNDHDIPPDVAVAQLLEHSRSIHHGVGHCLNTRCFGKRALNMPSVSW